MTDYAGKLYAKLAEVVQEVEGVAKSGTNEFHKYKYTTAEEMLRALRGPLASRKIALLPALTAINEREITTAKGGVSTITTVRVTFTLVDGETGETVDCPWAGQGDDPGDKGLGKAYTNAIKTFLREQFLIPQGDDPEADERTDKRAADRVKPVSQAATDASPMSDTQLRNMWKALSDAPIPDEQKDLILAAEGIEAGSTEVSLAQGRAIRRRLDGVTA